MQRKGRGELRDSGATFHKPARGGLHEKRRGESDRRALSGNAAGAWKPSKEGKCGARSRAATSPEATLPSQGDPGNRDSLGRGLNNTVTNSRATDTLSRDEGMRVELAEPHKYLAGFDPQQRNSLCVAALVDTQRGCWAAAGGVTRRLASGGSGADPFYNDPGPREELPHSLRPRPQAPRTRGGIPLPEGWAEFKSPSRGVYYAHAATGVTQFQVPTGQPSQQQVRDSFLQTHGDRVASLRPGARVQLGGIQSAPQLNGATGTVQQWDIAGGRVRVRLDAGQVKDVKLANVAALPGSTPAARASTAQRARRQAGSAASGAAAPGPSSSRLGAPALAGGVVAVWAGYKWYEARWFSTRTSKLDGSTF
ncbi:unnamed protein product [Prorocentrum cordatum]|uniref:WW domain-containing protein n=1 Tax=Prorocentrum cordatum TaxID=2364126 RepID=A0ABN9T9P4_9DINO|nr:unnamed protein product [Polarella glacialis]